MMGRPHAAIGAAAWAGAVALAAPHLGQGVLAPLAGVPAIVVALVGTPPATGAALVPDADHPNGTIAHSVGPVTKLVTHGISLLAGGHREATHRLWFWALSTAVVFSVHFAAVNAPARPTDGSFAGSMVSWVIGRADLLTYFVLTAFGQRALSSRWLNAILTRIRPSLAVTGHAVGALFFIEAALITAAAAVVLPHAAQWLWLPFVVSIAHLTHLVGDAMTTDGIEILGRRVRLPIFGDADSRRSNALAPVMFTVYGLELLAILGVLGPVVRAVVGVLGELVRWVGAR